MINRMIALSAALTILAFPIAARAQGIGNGAAQGAHDGDRAAGPVGAVVGGVVGGIGGAVAGLLGLDQQPRFREYVVHEHHESFVYDSPVVIGTVLPQRGVTFYDMPPEYGLSKYQYTIVNGQTVLVEPASREIVEVIQ